MTKDNLRPPAAPPAYDDLFPGRVQDRQTAQVDTALGDQAPEYSDNPPPYSKQASNPGDQPPSYSELNQDRQGFGAILHDIQTYFTNWARSNGAAQILGQQNIRAVQGIIDEMNEQLGETGGILNKMANVVYNALERVQSLIEGIVESLSRSELGKEILTVLDNAIRVITDRGQNRDNVQELQQSMTSLTPKQGRSAIIRDQYMAEEKAHQTYAKRVTQRQKQDLERL